ncbi:sigma factor-like helix-turn-helix DNA-binding protein [Streptomyces sp. NBC_00448]|uniref:sigma factor-like helix-turn-helix DNA-binding protein n=1 Tax=Streptomyces sp. NBC_00448 TaxID=2903652 RepID=UPI002E2359B5
MGTPGSTPGRTPGRQRRAAAGTRRDAEFAAFVAGAGGRLLHSALLLTGDRADAERLLTDALARLYADWQHLLDGDDPYDRARSELFVRYAYRPWRRLRGGALDGLSARERLIITMRYFEGIGEEQTAALLGMGVERVGEIAAHSGARLRSRPARVGPRAARSRTASAVGR